MDYLNSWSETLLKARSLVFDSRMTVVGERDQHLGPRWEFAKITVSVEPAATFEVVNTVEVGAELKSMGFPDWAVYGVLDVLLVAESSPLTAVRLTFHDAAWDATDTSAMAFRQAGRDAGRKIIAALKSST